MISSTNLQIISFGREHITPNYIGWLNSPVLMQFSEQRHRSHTFDSCQKYLQSFEGSPHLFCAIIYKKENIHIGNMSVYLDEKNKVADMGIMIGHTVYSGKGLGLEAWSSMIHYLFANRDIRKITAGTMALNTAMLKVMEKSGMQPDGIKKKQFLLNEQEVDLVQMAIFRKTSP